MSKAYWIATYIEIFDADKLASYAALALPAITAAGGRFMARGMPDAIHEAGKTTRTVIIEFESVAAAEAAIGLAILVCFFRNRGSIAVEDVNMMKG